MHIHMQTHTNIHIWTCKSSHMHRDAHMHAHMQMYIFRHTQTCTCAHMCMHISTHVGKRSYAHRHTLLHTNTHACTNIHINIGMYTHNTHALTYNGCKTLSQEEREYQQCDPDYIIYCLDLHI